MKMLRRSNTTRGPLYSMVIGLVLVLAIATGADSCDTVSGNDSSSGAEGATEVSFSVTGSAPNGVDITYGSDSSNYDGSPPPFAASLTIDENALYYAVSAQLMGGGDVTCEVRIGDIVRTGHAVGGYNICSAQLNKSYDGGWG